MDAPSPASSDQIPAWFPLQLAETLAWCQGRANLADPQGCLRSSELAPELDPDEPYEWMWATSKKIEHVVQRRRRLLAERGIVVEPSMELRGGRLLLSNHGLSNHNGGTADCVSKFFNNNDVLPWDLWVAEVKEPLTEQNRHYQPSIMACWIPAEFMATMQEGMEGECMGIFRWADDAEGLKDWIQWYPAYPAWLWNLLGRQC